MNPGLALKIFGQMPSGKGQIRTQIVRGGLHRFPTTRFVSWRLDAWNQIIKQRGAWAILRQPARVHVRYTPGDLIRRDVPGMMDALCHLLEWCPFHGKKKTPNCNIPFISDDSLLVNWSWQHEELDRQTPKIELTIFP